MLENRIWILITKKLSGEATEQDLEEIEKLLRGNRGLFLQVDMLLSDWNNKKIRDENISLTAFGKMVEKIRAMQEPEAGAGRKRKAVLKSF